MLKIKFDKLNVLADPLFICALTVLLLNDLCFKPLFHDFLTGKLSDFAGIIVFVLFWTALFPKYKKQVFILTSALFLFWKLPVSQGFIDLWNTLKILPLSRICDPADLTALMILPFVYQYRPRKIWNAQARFLRIPLAFLALFSFCATSYNSTVEINKKYSFPFSINELVFRLNNINHDCGITPLSLNYNLADSVIVSGTDTGFVSYSGNGKSYSDTMYKYNSLLQRSTNEIDTVYHYVFREVDTNYIHGSNAVNIHFDASRIIKDTSYGYCRCFDARIIIKGNADTSSLTLRSVSAGGCIYPLKQKYNKDLKEVIQAAFEKEVIRKIYWKEDKIN
jgi:hypothetical protein